MLIPQKLLNKNIRMKYIHIFVNIPIVYYRIFVKTFILLKMKSHLLYLNVLCSSAKRDPGYYLLSLTPTWFPSQQKTAFQGGFLEPVYLFFRHPLHTLSWYISVIWSVILLLFTGDSEAAPGPLLAFKHFKMVNPN